MSDKIPDPGIEEAIEMGCTCPVMDNNYGEGYMGMEGVFVFNINCPIHGDQKPIILPTGKINEETK